MGTLFNEKDANSIRTRIGSLTPEGKGAWGKMNVGQMLCHCNDGMRAAVGELKAEDKSSFLMRTVAKFLVINVIQIPKDVPTARELDQDRDGTPPEDFATDRTRLLGTIDLLVTLPMDFKFSPHIRFGPMSRREWGIMGYKHLDHHLRQFGV